MQHTTIGERMLSNSFSQFIEVGRVIAYNHHERWDGRGYPNGLKGNQIPIYSRIVTVADVFDALTSARPYKHAWKEAKAIEEIQKGQSAHFDPRVVEAFISGLPEILQIKNKYQEGVNS